MVTYERINNIQASPGFYAKGTGAVYPTQDVDGALYVVKEVDFQQRLGRTLLGKG